MIPDLDIYRAANLLVKRHGQDAPVGTTMFAVTSSFPSRQPPIVDPAVRRQSNGY